jgi:hypothetical protein
MAKASNKLSLKGARRELVQNVLVDLVRTTIQHGVSQGQLGVELMAQGYAILTAKDLAEARVAVAGMIEHWTDLKNTAAKIPSAKKSPKKGSTAKKRPTRKSPATGHGTTRKPR